jgi:hypothetical protein
MRNDNRVTLPVQGNRYADEHIRRVGFQRVENGAPDRIKLGTLM